MQTEKAEAGYLLEKDKWKWGGATYKQTGWLTIITITYLSLAALLLGLKPEHIGLAILFNVLFYLSAITRKFILGFSIFLSYSVVFDFMKAFPNYLVGHVNISGIYLLEKSLFGIHFNGAVLTPNEYFLQHLTPFLNVLTGLFYLCWIPVPLIFMAFLFFTNRKQFMHFSLAFMVINVIGFTIYYILPTAPPWYVQTYGFNFVPGAHGTEAGLARFDSYFHISIFKGIYSKSSNVFAALPSLHSAYPMVVFYYGVKNRLGLINVLFFTIMLGIWFAAVYTSHHYVIDVLSGIACGITGLLLFEKVLLKAKFFQPFLRMYERAIM